MNNSFNRGATTRECAVAPDWFESLLERPDVTDICLNSGTGVFFDRGNGMEPYAEANSYPWPEEQIREWVVEKIASAGKAWDARHPFVDASLPSGHRLHVAFPPLARPGLLISLRRMPSPPQRAAIERWSATSASAALFEQLRGLVERGDSLLISGATGSGKTTLASDLLGCVPTSERILALEDTPELAPRHPHFLTLVSRPPNADGFGEVTLRTLLRQALRMRPDRIILGECRGAEVLDLLQALNTGHRGALATLHANSARDALRRVELLCLLAFGGSVPPLAIRELLSVGIQWVAQVRRGPYGREVSELWKMEGREGETLLLRQILPEVSRVG